MENLKKYLYKSYNEIDNLCKRLQDNYNNDVEFEQHEEDRLVIYNILEKIDILKEQEETTKIEENLIEILENSECYTITQALKDCKNTFELLCIINYILYDVIDLVRYDLETEQDKKDFEELQKIKDKILEIKKRNYRK